MRNMGHLHNVPPLPGHLTPAAASSSEIESNSWSKAPPMSFSIPACCRGSVMGIGQWGCLLDPQNADLFSSSYPSGTAGQSILNHGEPYRTMSDCFRVASTAFSAAKDHVAWQARHLEHVMNFSCGHFAWQAQHLKNVMIKKWRAAERNLQS